MKKELNEQVAVITGASRGLGKSICMRFAELGIKIATIARSEEELVKLQEDVCKAGGSIITFKGDVTDYQNLGDIMRQTYETFGSIDILINNAGTGVDTPFEDLTLEDIDSTIDVNLKGVIYATKQVVPYMAKSGYGNIINISSIAAKRGVNVSTNSNGIYTASKFGVSGFSDTMDKYLLKYNIHVSAICPGAINTSWWDRWYYPHDKKAMIPPEYIVKIVELILLAPESVVFKQASLVTTVEADLW